MLDSIETPFSAAMCGGNCRSYCSSIAFARLCCLLTKGATKNVCGLKRGGKCCLQAVQLYFLPSPLLHVSHQETQESFNM